jgi:hypothetical protein
LRPGRVPRPWVSLTSPTNGPQDRFTPRTHSVTIALLDKCFLWFKFILSGRFAPVPPVFRRPVPSYENPMPTKPPPEAVLARAAELRATGHTWEATAKLLKRSSGVIQRWPLKYPDRWAAALRDAQRRAITDCAAESLVILRQLLRADDGKLRLGAAEFLADLRVEQAKLDLKAGEAAPEVPPLALQIAHYMENHTDEDIAQMADFLRRPPLAERVLEHRVLPGRAD